MIVLEAERYPRQTNYTVRGEWDECGCGCDCDPHPVRGLTLAVRGVVPQWVVWFWRGRTGGVRLADRSAW